MTNQELAFEKLSKLKVGALFMEMGTGKTKVALDLMYSKREKADFFLWICPFSIRDEIERERLKWHPDLTLSIVGCESIGSSSRVYMELLEKVSSHKSFIVVDESLKIKNLRAKRTIRILHLGDFALYKLILNGTPISKNVLDLYPQMKFLSSKILNMQFNTFKDTFCEYYLNGELKGKVKKQHNVEHLISLINPYIFDSELYLGKKKHYYEYDYLVEDEEEYENIKHYFITFDSDSSFFSIATLLQHYYCTTQTKKELVNAILDDIQEQVIVFVKYVESIPQGEEKITGDTKDRDAIITRFKNGEFKTLYMTYGVGAFGLNLQFCRNMIFADHTFDYAQRLQAEARIFRIGQEQDVNYYNINCMCGLDNLIRKCLDKKTRLLDEIKKEIEKEGLEAWKKAI